VLVPRTVTVAEGATSAMFTIATERVPGKRAHDVDVTAFYNGITATATLTVTPTAVASSQAPVALCASASLDPCLTRAAIPNATIVNELRYTFYTPELSLMEESITSTTNSPPIAYDYVWFGGHPLAQIANATGEISWYFNDHLGTPLLQTNAVGQIVWQAEYEPYGGIYAMRRGESRHQPLRLPGQVADDGTELYQNVYRWYRPTAGRYTQSDPVNRQDINSYLYAYANPGLFADPWGLFEIAYSVVTKPTLSPGSICGSPIACSLIGAALTASCKCDANIGRVVAENVTLRIAGAIYYYNGPFGSISQRATVDRSVVDAQTAIHHEYAFHINQASLEVTRALLAFEAHTYSSTEACQRAVNAMSGMIHRYFAAALEASQRDELARR
jgi:RHS repeat-associated protein